MNLGCVYAAVSLLYWGVHDQCSNLEHCMMPLALRIIIGASD